MQRRDFIAWLGAAAVWPLAARAQQRPPMRRIGVLAGAPTDAGAALISAFAQGLQEHGWTIGTNVRIDYRLGASDADLRRRFAVELVALKPDVMLVLGSTAMRAAQASTRSIPTVFVGVTDPVSQGFVADRAHPGGNVTGFAVFEYSIASKWVELLREVSPTLSHFAVVFDPETTPGGWLPLIRSVAPVFHLDMSEAPVHNDRDIDNVTSVLRTSSDAAILVLPSSFTMAHSRHIIDFAAGHALPAIYWDSRFVKFGGLMSYAYDLEQQVEDGVGYASRILNGQKAGDLPVQSAEKFDLVVNRKTAKALSLPIPPSLLGIPVVLID